MKKEDEIKARADAALKAITANPQITVNELASALSVSRKQTENALKRLKESGRIHREGSARNGKWIIDWSHRLTHKPTKQVPRMIGNSLVGYFDAVSVYLYFCFDADSVQNIAK